VAIIEARELRLTYATDRGPVRAVDGVSFSVGPGESVGIIGETGSGKTSLVHALSRVFPHNVTEKSGSVMLNGRDITLLSEDEFRRQIRWKEIAIVFQSAMNGFNPVIRVGAQITERAVADGGNESNLREQAKDLLERVGLPRSVYDRYPHELSGGMKQRAALAMALLLTPAVVILDEPTSALDVSVQAQIMNTLKQLKWDLSLSMIFITHDIALASDLCDRLVVMYAGQVREAGTVDDVLMAPKDPYTRALLASMPRLGEETPRLLAGESPDPVNPPAGCRFHPRCPEAFDRCRVEPPPLIPVAGGSAPGAAADDREWVARCWLGERS